MPTNLRSYWKTLWAIHLKRAMPWAWSNIVWAIVILIGPPAAIMFRNRSANIDWDLIRTTLWFYFFGFVVYVFVHLGRAIWKAHVKSEETIEQQKEELVDLKAKLDSLQSDSLPWRAMGLCKEINSFVSEFGPAQEIKYTSGMSAEHFTQENAEGIERQSNIGAGFTRRFSLRVTDIYNEFCEHGREWEDKELENVMTERMDDFVDSQIKTVVDRLKQLSAKMWAETTLRSPRSSVCTQDSETQSI